MTEAQSVLPEILHGPKGLEGAVLSSALEDAARESKLSREPDLIPADGLVIFDPERERRRNTITRRLDVNMGFACNERCSFCYYLEDIVRGTTGDADTEEVKRRLRVGRKWGKVRVDLTGGEPTIRKDLEEIVAYAREIGYREICIITNCVRIGRQKGYLARLVEAGLNDILMSLHGATAETHDGLTKLKGSFEAVLKAAELAWEFPPLRRRFNFVVCQENYDECEAAADLMASHAPFAINFILFHPTRDAKRADEKIKFRNYEEAVAPVRRAIEKHRHAVPHLNVRDLPYCLLKGLERHVKPLYQLQYETAEWDYCLDVLFKRKRGFYLAGLALGAILSLGNPHFWRAGLEEKKHIAIQRARIRQMRQKGPQCRACALNHICDGLDREYVERYGTAELVPYRGPRITNPTYFMPRDEIE